MAVHGFIPFSGESYTGQFEVLEVGVFGLPIRPSHHIGFTR